MTKEAIIQKTVEALNALPEEKAEQVSAFAEFILKRYQEEPFQQSTEKQKRPEPRTFDFADEDRELQLE